MIREPIVRSASSTMVVFIVNGTMVYEDPWATGTAPIWHNFPTQASNLSPLPVLPPKNWRWFGAFRQAIECMVAVAQIAAARQILRRTFFLSLAVRRRQKRRHFVQKLRAAA